MKVTVTNTALLNTGDAAIMLGTAEILTRAFGRTVEMRLHDQQAEEAGRLYPSWSCAPVIHDAVGRVFGARLTKVGIAAVLLAALAWRMPGRNLALRMLPAGLRASLRHFLESDLILSAGGTYLVPHYRLGPKLLELLVARLAGVPYALFTQSLGPFTHRRWLLRFLLNGARVVFVRDARSVEHLTELGVRRRRIATCADAAFALPAHIGQNGARHGGRPSIAISVREWPHFDGSAAEGMIRYLAAIRALVTHLVERYQAEIVFLSTCQGVQGYWTDDSEIATLIVDGVPASTASAIEVDRAFRTPEALRERLASVDLMISTRMHGAILAIGAGTPVVPIAYEFKTRELFRELDMEDLVQDIETLDADRLIRTVDGALAQRDRLHDRIPHHAEMLRDSAMSAAAIMRAAVGARS